MWADFAEVGSLQNDFATSATQRNPATDCKARSRKATHAAKHIGRRRRPATLAGEFRSPAADEVLGPTLTLDKLRRAIATRRLDRLARPWDEMRQWLVAYKKQHRHLRVRKDDPDPWTAVAFGKRPHRLCPPHVRLPNSMVRKLISEYVARLSSTNQRTTR